MMARSSIFAVMVVDEFLLKNHASTKTIPR